MEEAQHAFAVALSLILSSGFYQEQHVFSLISGATVISEAMLLPHGSPQAGDEMV